MEVHDHRSASASQAPTLSSSSSHLRLTSGAFTSLTDEADLPTINPEASARALGGNYGFLNRLGIDPRQRNGDQSGPSSPNVYRVVLYPSAEALWTDLRTLNEVEGAGLWTDEEVLEIESRIIVSAGHHGHSILFCAFW